MPLILNHYTVMTVDLESSRFFYEDILGLTVGPRPPFAFSGLWMYRGEHDDFTNAVVHLICVTEAYQNTPVKSEIAVIKKTGAIDHIAFIADGLEAMLNHLNQHKVEFTDQEVPVLGLYQIFLIDPNNIKIELNYSAKEKLALRSK